MRTRLQKCNHCLRKFKVPVEHLQSGEAQCPICQIPFSRPVEDKARQPVTEDNTALSADSSSSSPNQDDNSGCLLALGFTVLASLSLIEAFVTSEFEVNVGWVIGLYCFSTAIAVFLWATSIRPGGKKLKDKVIAFEVVYGRLPHADVTKPGEENFKPGGGHGFFDGNIGGGDILSFAIGNAYRYAKACRTSARDNAKPFSERAAELEIAELQSQIAKTSQFVTGLLLWPVIAVAGSLLTLVV